MIYLDIGTINFSINRNFILIIKHHSVTRIHSLFRE